MNQGTMPAYPLRVAEDGYMSTYRGMSKREVFAMAAMQGILSNAGDYMRGNAITNSTPANVADMAVEHADALLAALEKSP